MDCAWDAAILQLVDQLPSELLEVIRSGGDQQYLESITQATLDARYTHILFAHCGDLFAQVCSRLRDHGSLARSIATLGRITSFAPHLTLYARRLLANERYHFGASEDSGEDTMYLLALFRLLVSDWRTFKPFVDPSQISELLRHPSRPVVYLAIRVLQLYLQGADHWFESMVRMYLGEDSPESAIDGPWDDITIDYRFLTLWEQERHEKLHSLITSAGEASPQTAGSELHRVLSSTSFDPSVALVGGLCFPRDTVQPVDLSANLASSVIETSTVRRNMKAIARAITSPLPLLLSGLAGSGKTLLIRHTAMKLGKLDQMLTLHLNEQSDAKLLVGIYTTGDTAGSFVWKPGVLTTAVREGRWVLIEDLDRAPNEVIGTLLPLMERGELMIPSRKQTIHAAPGFRIIATVRSVNNHRGEESTPLNHMIGARLWQRVQIAMPSLAEQREIAHQLFPTLHALLPQYLDAFDRLHMSKARLASSSQSKAGMSRSTSPRDLLKWCSRSVNLMESRKAFTSTDMDDIFLEAVDCFLGALSEGSVKEELAASIAETLHIDPQRREYLLTDREARYAVDKTNITIGRYRLNRNSHAKKTMSGDGIFSTNPHTSRTLERVAAGVINREPLLLVGETGVGKTTAVQHLANHLSKKLVAFNLSQQSEAGDLLGGFKPVNARSLIVPMNDEFDELFTASFSMSKNQEFLELLGKQISKGNWKAVCKLWQRALKMVEQQRTVSAAVTGEAPSKKRRVESRRTMNFDRWDAFSAKVSDLEKRLAAGGDAFAFSFVEGSIVKAVRNGDWILLDEINLASTDTLESIAELLDPVSPSLLLTEAGDVQRIDAHPEFRVFAAMNPATDVGKKDLPPGIRSRFTELYVESPDKDLRSLQSIVRSYLRQEAAADQAVPLDVSTLYQKIIALGEQNKLADGAGQKPHFSLRTLTRTLSYAKHIASLCSLRRALYEGFQMSFLTFLDAESAALVQPLLQQQLFGKRTNVNSELQKALRKPNDGHGYVQGWPGSKHWVRQGSLPLEDQPHYILTPFIRSNIENLVRATSTRQFPVLIQGPTSSGKTSMIEYLAKRTGHKFVRINNHEHTDLQEYLGTYVSGTDGRLQFQEGILVKALREGHWIVLDELNLAPTDVLEALNRLLDDNRELLIPETQEVVRPHESFMLFATQNPAGLYGGRKTLSRAFRNRFLELHFDDIPIDELQEILHRRTQLPESRCKRVVAVYRELSVLRQESRMFEQKSFATLRDLFRWALRPNDTIEQLAANGFMLLAERVRKLDERQILKEVIEKAMSAKGPQVIIDEHALYARESREVQQYHRTVSSQDVVWTKAMRRLYVLVSRAIANNEPVLLVGETGCGKTTVCQMLAEAFDQELHTVNAHQNTETGDLIGSQRPIRNRAVIEAELRSQLLASSQMQYAENASAPSTSDLLDAYDEVISNMSKVDQSAHIQSAEHLAIQSGRTRFRALFEWSDGSLVQAMKSGAFFLLDEISLADDSVLERINSVLEPQRSILLAEKGSLDSFTVAASGFQFFATMNPGGDYGKKELSPALRNRFTEIWVPSLSDADDVSEIVSAKLVPMARPFATAIVTFAQWFKNRYNTSASSSISIRDALAWVTFVNAAGKENVEAAVVHGAAMVYIDTLGANPAGLMTMTRYGLDEERQACLYQLGRLMQKDVNAIYSADAQVHFTDLYFNAGSFRIPRMQGEGTGYLGFSFDPPTTKVNAMRVVRALQLSKPVMLEGNPGVGKTALVTAIAEAACVPLTRINLSEQTDLIDLFGSDVPIEGAETGSFTWRDAPFLRAMKKGEWALLDEMNLASQSVLEGLNACLDHRGEVFVPELGQTFTRHPHFRLFAAQNPHHQGGGRKGLPASFVNRFTVVYADAFRADDLKLICRRRFPSVDGDLVAKAVSFIEQLEYEVSRSKSIGMNGGPWEFNLRDISRWLALSSSDQRLLQAGSSRDFVDSLFSQRFRSTADHTVVAGIFQRVFGFQPRSDIFPSVSTQALQVGLGLLARNPDDVPLPSKLTMGTQRACHVRTLESLMLCIQQNWPVILTGSSGVGKTALIERLASAVGAPLATIAMNSETDSMDLIGGYEQFDPHRQSWQTVHGLQRRLLHDLKGSLASDIKTTPVDTLDLLQRVESALSTDALDSAPLVHALSSSANPNLRELAGHLQRASSQTEKARFEWIDGLLVDAVQEGKWLVLDNANFCSASVLDRLNSLLEPNGTLIINEHSTDDGSARVIQPHANFRIFMTLDSRFGELSRAMRNRAVELHLSKDQLSQTHLDPLFSESAVARLRLFRAVTSSGASAAFKDRQLLVDDHLGICDEQLLPRFQSQLGSGLYGGRESLVGSLTKPVELLKQSRSFNADLISQLQGPADFALVQTLHPLNNQPLICTSPHTLSQASSQAVLFDLQVELGLMQRLLHELQSNSLLIKQVRRLEQSWNIQSSKGASKAKGSHIVQALQQVVICLSEFAQSSPALPADTVQDVRLLFGRLRAIWTAVHDTLSSEQVDQATINVLMLIASELLRSCPPPLLQQLSTTLSRLAQAFEQLLRTNSGTQGQGCTVLWQALRPATPATLVQLQEVLDFEILVERFDALCRVPKLSLDDAAQIRIQLAQALRLAKRGGEGLAELTSKLASLGLGAEEANEDQTSRSSHFLPAFKSLHERLVHTFNDSSDEATLALSKLEISAHLPTIRSRLSAEANAGALLQARSARMDTGGDEDFAKSDSLTIRIANADQVPLSALETFTAETKLLGKIMSSHAHDLSAPELNSLDDCLRTAFQDFVKALQSSEDEVLQGLAAVVLSGRTNDRSNGASGMSGAPTWLTTALCNTEEYLHAPPTDVTERRKVAAVAWISFALAGLHLYISSAAFDPALEPLLRLQLHKQQRRSLSTRFEALRALRSVLSGEPDSLRARLVCEDIDTLGPDPEAVIVCRPAVSELAKLQSEFDGLLRTMQPLQQAFEDEHQLDSLDRTFLANIDRTRSRLKSQYRAYDDLTEPVVLFIDYLSTANDLISRSRDVDRNSQQLSIIVPFANASFDTWLDDGVFLEATHTLSGVGGELAWLGALALRCKVRSLDVCSLELHARTEEAFEKFYVAWRAELSEDQQKTAAKSSLYKYRGNEDDKSEPTQDDLDELFPSGEIEQSATRSQLSKTMQDRAHAIAKLHAWIYSHPQSDENNTHHLLRQWQAHIADDPLLDGNDYLLPSTILSVGELVDSLLEATPTDKGYDMYTDSNLPASRKLFTLLQKIRTRFAELQNAWPEHATPGNVLILCSQIFEISYAAPIPRFFPLLEKVHATVTEWQKIASREYSASMLLDELTNTIIDWRQLELSAWAGIFDREWQQCEQTAASWWFVAYESIIATVPHYEASVGQTRKHAEDLLLTLTGFMSASGLGEYSARLQLLRNFDAELAASSGDGSKLAMHAALQNFIAYYGHFEKLVSEALQKGRADLEKEAKNVVQVASWKDRNIDTLRQSAQSSHRKLLRLVKKYRSLLAQPVTSIVQGGLPLRLSTVVTIGSEKVKTIQHKIRKEDGRLLGIGAWDQRAERFQNSLRTAQLLVSKAESLLEGFSGADQLRTFCVQLEKDITELQKATPAMLTAENKAHVNHLKTRKRRLFADVLKEVRAMGFQSSMSMQALSSQASTDRILAQLPAMGKNAERLEAETSVLKLHQLMDIMSTVRQSARTHAEDLTPAEVSRSLSLLESMLQQSLLQYVALNKHSLACARLQETTTQLLYFATTPKQRNNGEPTIERMSESLASFLNILPVCIRILRYQTTMAEFDDASFIEAFAEHERQARALLHKTESLPSLPPGVDSKDAADMRQTYKSIQNSVKDLAAAAASANPAIEPVMAQLLRWICLEPSTSLKVAQNGYSSGDKESWTSRLLETTDSMLVAIQKAEQIRKQADTDYSWLLAEQARISLILDQFNVDQTTSALQRVLSDIQRIDEAGDSEFEETALMCRSVCPIIESYTQAVTSVLKLRSDFYGQATDMANQLARVLVTLCQKGFCTPSNKSDDQSGSEGNVESGTGLGDGEGAEDISKDIAPDEDLSELAQEAKREQKDGEMDNEKDAVDMADEDLEGDMEQSGDQNEDEDGDGTGDDAEEGGEMDEEAGEVDDQGPSTIDEKMWDSGKDDSHREKETDEAQGQKGQDDVAADKQDPEQQVEEGEDNHENAGGEETEDVQREAPEQVDAHTREDETLDLPEDMAMDKEKAADDRDSDTESGDDFGDSVSEAEADTQDDSGQQEAGVDNDDPQQQDERDDDMGQMEAGDEATEEDAASDVLMQDNDHMKPDAEPQPDVAQAPEAGSGPDQADDNEQDSGQGKAAGGPSDGQMNDDEQDSEDQNAQGAQTTGEAPSGEDGNREDKLPFKQIGDALHEWYNQNTDIQKAEQPDRTNRPRDATQQPQSTQFQHLPDEDAQADTQALGTASAEETTALDQDNALSVNDEQDPTDVPFQDEPEQSSAEANDQSAREDKMQLEPSDQLRQDPHSGAFVGDAQEMDIDMADGAEMSEEDEVDNVDQQLLQTHISHEDNINEPTVEEARQQWAAHEESTRNLALSLTEQLRLILQPTQATKMRGDFRTGKRLNIKRIIPYIASSYKRDKIWMRRSVPSKRAYQIMLAIDDSKSMMESESRHLAFETLAMVTKGLSMLEVGELSIVGFGEEVKVAHDFGTPFSSDAGAEIFKKLSFAQNKTNVRKLLAESIELFRAARMRASSAASDLWQLQIVVSDGICEDHPSIRHLVRQAHEERIMIVFVIVDAAAQSKAAESGIKQSILDLQTAEFAKDASGEMQLKMVKYLDTFPFRYYLIVRDVQELPGVLAGALRQWFAEVVETSG